MRVKSIRAARATWAPSRGCRARDGETSEVNLSADASVVAPFREERRGIGTGDGGTAAIAITSAHSCSRRACDSGGTWSIAANSSTTPRTKDAVSGSVHGSSLD